MSETHAMSSSKSSRAAAYLYDGLMIAQESNGSVTSSILSGPRIDERLARTQSSDRTYLLGDALESTVALTDSAGGRVQQYAYDAYGNQASLYGGNIVAADVGLRLDDSGQGYVEPTVPSDNFRLNRWSAGSAFLRELKSLVTKDIHKLISNFFQMPGVLRFISGMSLLHLLFVGRLILPSTINLRGREVSAAEWGNGSAWVLLISSVPLIASGFLLLLRSKHSRAINLVGWILVNLAPAWIVCVNGVSVSRTEVVGYVLLSIVVVGAFAIYMYGNASVKAYMRGKSLAPSSDLES